MLDLEHFTSLPRGHCATEASAAPRSRPRGCPQSSLRANPGIAGGSFVDSPRTGASAPHADTLRVAAVPPRAVAAAVDRAADGRDAVTRVCVRPVATQPVSPGAGLDDDAS